MCELTHSRWHAQSLLTPYGGPHGSHTGGYRGDHTGDTTRGTEHQMLKLVYTAVLKKLCPRRQSRSPPSVPETPNISAILRSEYHDLRKLLIARDLSIVTRFTFGLSWAGFLDENRLTIASLG
jgi:hypothetical protein